uniref:Uncharacterized protein n=1 Tax=Oryza nivara TaxID=4536 RepID=A0A0E0IE96_ORYNI
MSSATRELEGLLPPLFTSSTAFDVASFNDQPVLRAEAFFPLIRLVHSHWTIGFGGLEAARFSSPELKATATGSSDGGGTSSLMKKQINIANIDARGVASAGSKGSGGAA